MICPNCHAGYMIQHHETKLALKKWLSCSCGFCCKEKDLVDYYKKEPSERAFTGMLSTPERVEDTEESE